MDQTPSPHQPDPADLKKQPSSPPSASAPAGGLLSQDPNMKANPPSTGNSNSNMPPPPPKKTVKGKKLGAGFFLGCFGLFAFLFVIFVVLSVMTLQSNSAFLKQLNLSPLDVQRILSGLVNISFGLLSLILLIVLVTGVFSRILTKKDEKDRRRKSSFRILLAAVAFVVDIIIWIFVSYSISSIQIADNSAINAYIQVYDAQTNQLLTNATNLTAPVELNFDAANVTKQVKPGLETLSYEWDLDGDGKFGDKTGEKVSWRYEDKGKNNGIYAVNMKLSVKDAKAQVQTQLFPVSLSIAAVKPKVVLVVSPETGEAPLKVTFDATGSYDPDGQDPKKDISFAWEVDADNAFDDGSQATLTHTFDTIGSFPVQVRVQDRDKMFTVMEKTITVTGIRQDTPQAKIQAAPQSGNVPLLVQFSGENSTSPGGKITKYEWDFGDGTLPERSMVVSHTFTKPGTYPVQLKVVDIAGKEGATSVDIQVQGQTFAPQIKLVTSPAYQDQGGKKVIEGSAPLVIHFDATQSTDQDNDIVDYQWDLDGDGEFETRGAKPEPHTYYDQEETNVQLKVIDSAQHEVKETVLVRVKYKPLEAIIKASPVSGAAPLTVSFDGSASRYNNGSIEQYQWDFNDGTPPKIYNALIQYTFNKVGLYHVKLTVLTNDAKQAFTTQDIIVTEIPLIARFVTNVKNGQAPLPVSFDPSPSTGKIVRYFWDFGDGVVSSERKPTHTFSSPGTYTVVLTIYSQDNITNTYSDQITVQ